MSGGQEVYRIHETQVSCVVYGHDEWQWTACAFIDNAHESGDLYDDGEFHEGDGEDGEAVVGQKVDGFDEDPIATGLHVSKPIWRPRQYFTKALEVNIKEVSQEWQELIHKMECDIIAYVMSFAISTFHFKTDATTETIAYIYVLQHISKLERTVGRNKMLFQLDSRENATAWYVH